MLCQDLGDSDKAEVITVRETRTAGYDALSRIMAFPALSTDGVVHGKDRYS